MNFTVERNDIARMEVDAVVLPANWRLKAGTGASLAIFEAAGKDELEAECALQSERASERGIRLVPGVCVPTHAFALPSKVILHTIVPKWRPDEIKESYEDLCKAYAAALVMADKMGMESIAFPVLAAGNNGFDADIAIDIALQSLEQYEPMNKLAQAYLVTFGANTTQAVRDRGIKVEEHIDQVYVLDQDMQQAAWRRQEREKDKPFVQAAIDKGFEWIQVQDNQLLVARLALDVIDVALPKDKAPEVVRKAIDEAKKLLSRDH